MYRLLLLLCLFAPLAAQTATQICPDGRVLPLTPFNRNPCGSTPATTPAPSSETPPADSSPDSTLTCEDGRIVQRTPFNPNPCRVSAPAPPSETPDEFLALFGETPAPVGLEIEDRLAEQAYRARYDSFVGGAPTPDGFDAVAERFARAGLGEAGFYQARNGLRVRWLDAPFYPADAALDEALERPDAVIATWQAQAILRGGVVSDALTTAPATVRALNDERRSGDAGPESSTPDVLTWAPGSNLALAASDDAPELVGPAGGYAVLTAPAQPGKFIRLFATGLGDASSLSVSLGGVTLAASDFAFSRVADSRGGVWCVVVRVPADAPSGELPVTLTADGVSSHPGPYLTVSR